MKEKIVKLYKKLDRVYKMLNKQNDVIRKLKKSKDDGYHERNKLVSALSKLYPACLGKHEESDTEWHKEWMTIVYIKLPTGQVSWHLHDSDVPYFAHLDYSEKVRWDGHSTEEKYERLLALN